MANFVVGKIINMHGIKGEFKVFPETDDLDRFNKLSFVLIKGDKYEVEKARPHKGCILLKVKGIDSINDGERFKNEYVEIPEEDAMPLLEGEYYIRDIYDCKVYTIDDNKYIGIVTDIYFTASNDVFEVTMENGKTVLLPNINDCIKEVDTENKIIKINLMEGLLD
ncbi:MAG: ribosome maturation factor RimM [Clostridia bacterium]|nr:ribosome maturation factor RimM [Clostridia bacterium]